jgi:hypothetical protein
MAAQAIPVTVLVNLKSFISVRVNGNRRQALRTIFASRAGTALKGFVIWKAEASLQLRGLVNLSNFTACDPRCNKSGCPYSLEGTRSQAIISPSWPA